MAIVMSEVQLDEALETSMGQDPDTLFGTTSRMRRRSRRQGLGNKGWSWLAPAFRVD